MRMPRMYRVAPVLMLSLLALSCSKHEVAPADADMAAASAPAMEEMAADAAAVAAPQKNLEAPAPQAPGVAASQLASDVLAQTDPQRRFIRTAAAEFPVKDVYRTALAIEDEVAKQGGFVVDNDIQAQVQRVESRPIGNGMRRELAEYRLQGELTVRVPSERTQGFLRAIASQMEFLDRRNFSARRTSSRNSAMPCRRGASWATGPMPSKRAVRREAAVTRR